MEVEIKSGLLAFVVDCMTLSQKSIPFRTIYSFEAPFVGTYVLSQPKIETETENENKTGSISELKVSEKDFGWTIKFGTSELKFQIGNPFDETTIDGREVRTVVSVDDNKFVSIQTAKNPSESNSKVTREFKMTEVVETTEIGANVFCVQRYKRQFD